ncbi:MAG: hypothetical protein ACUVQ5_03060 [Candidatus Methanomethylicaceae archaeon]
MRSAPRREGSCKICSRSALGEFCGFYREAIKRLREHFEIWKSRKGLTWEDYLKEVASNSRSGKWVREAAEYLLTGSQ